MMADVWLTPTLGASSVVTWPIPDNWVAWEVAHPSSVALEWPTRMARWKPQGPEAGTASSPHPCENLSALATVIAPQPSSRCAVMLSIWTLRPEPLYFRSTCAHRP